MADEKSTIWASFLCHKGRYKAEAERLMECATKESKLKEKAILVHETTLYFCLDAEAKNTISTYIDIFILIRTCTEASKNMMRFSRNRNISQKICILSSRCEVVMLIKLIEACKCEIEQCENTIDDFGSDRYNCGSIVTKFLVVPRKVHRAMEAMSQMFSWLHQCHEVWNEANALTAENNADFFAELDKIMGPLTMHSSIPDLVCYVQLGLNKVRGLQEIVQSNETL